MNHWSASEDWRPLQLAHVMPVCDTVLHYLQIQHGTSESSEKLQEYHAKLAGLYIQLHQISDAKQHLELLLDGTLALSDAKKRLNVQCQLADLQVNFRLYCKECLQDCTALPELCALHGAMRIPSTISTPARALSHMSGMTDVMHIITVYPIPEAATAVDADVI